MELPAFDPERGAAIAAHALNGSSHLAERGDNAVHGPFLNGFVSCQGDGKGLGREKAGEQSGGSSAVAAVQHAVRLFQPPHPVSVYQNPVSPVFNRNAHALKAGDRRQAVGPLKEAVDFRQASGNGSKHDASVGNGLVSGDGQLSPKTSFIRRKNHKKSSCSLEIKECVIIFF